MMFVHRMVSSMDFLSKTGSGMNEKWLQIRM